MKIKQSNKAWAAERAALAKTFLMLVGRPTRVLDVEPSQGDAIGYTSSSGTIHLAYKHEIMNGLTPEESKAFRTGVFAHEALHQIFTDFHSFEVYINSFPSHHKRIFGTLFNVVEDASIEYWAPTVMGGPLLKSLRFAIAHTYKVSPEISKESHPMEQFVNALIQFGDMGLVKGKIDNAQARQVFAKCAPLFNSAVMAEKCLDRLELTKQIFEISKALWESEAEMSKIMEKIIQSLLQEGRSSATGSGKGRDGDTSSLPEEALASKRRKITIKKVSKEEYESAGSGEGGSMPDDGDITLLVCDEEVEDDKDGKGTPISGEIPKSDDKEGAKQDQNSKDNANEGGSGNSSQKGSGDSSKSGSGGSPSGDSTENNPDNSSGEASNKGGSDNGTDCNDDGNPGDSDNGGGSQTSDNSPSKDSGENTSSNDTYNSSTDKNNNTLREHGNGANHCQGDDQSDDVADGNEISEEEYSLTDEDVEYIRSEAEKEMREYEEAQLAEGEDFSPLYDEPVGGIYSGFDCLNYRVTVSDGQIPVLQDAYSDIVGRLSPGIRSTTKQLQKIFEADKEEIEYRSSGRINLVRANSGRVTSRVFDRHRNPVEKNNLAVEIIVDESGSMGSSNKYIAAKECCIALAEIFNNLNIPLYVIGFTAGTQGHDVIHNHYVTWKNTQKDRLKLLNISDRSCNCDGYTIRYATEILKRKEAKNKLLIVISDGIPSYKSDLSDTKQAIREGKKNVSVLGVAIGNDSTEDIFYMYEKDFLHVSNANDLFFALAKKVKNLIKDWE